MQMAKLLVTGGAGFIGTNYVRARAAAHPDTPIIVLDAMTYSAKRANIDDLANVMIVEGDIRDEALVTQLLRDHDIDTLVHFAAESHVDRSISGPDIFIDSNIVGTHSLLKAARSVWLDGGSGTPHRFHHISTDEVFGSLSADDPAFHEETPYAPNSPYSASKAASDHLVRAYHHTYGLQTTMTNCSNNYGPYQFTEKLIPLFVINALTGKNLPVYGDGMNVRDWLHVDDHCRAIDLVLGGGRVGETYNVGGGEELPNMTVIKTICSTVDALFAGDAALAARFPQAPAAQGRSTDELITYVTDRAGHDRRYAIDCRKLERELSYAPAYDFAGGLAATIRWYVDHPAWWGYPTA
jgi:dTDP-glucose 4,6-dehydratase